MSIASDFFVGGGVQVGDYVSTERVDGFLEARGQDIFGFGYVDFEKATVINTTVDSFNTYVGSPYKCLVMQGSGRQGFFGIGKSAANNFKIRKVNFITMEETDVYDFLDTAFFSVDACISDIGDVIHFVTTNGVGSNVKCVTSLDSGSTWTEVSISGAITVSGDFTNDVLSSEMSIQCTPNGKSIRIHQTASNSNVSALYESNDFGATWAEVLTPRVTLVGTNQSFSDSSRDLSTSFMITKSGGFAVSEGGSMTDKSANLANINGSMRGSISSDGSSITVFDTTQGLTNKISIQVTTDNADTWRPYVFNLKLPLNVQTTCFIAGIQYIPQTQNMIAIVVTKPLGTSTDKSPSFYVYELSLVDQMTTLLSVIDKPSTSVNKELISYRYEVIKNNVGFVISFVDPQDADTAFVVGISEGMRLLNTSGEPKPLKAFVGNQVKGFGFNWTELDGVSTKNALSCYSSEDGTIVVSGANSQITRSGDSGATFTVPTSGFTSNVQGIDGANDGSLIIGSGLNEIRYSLDQGVTWNASSGFTGSTEANAISCISDGSTVIVGFRGGELDISTDSGLNFSNLSVPFSGENSEAVESCAIAKSNDQVMFVGNLDGLIRRSIDGGSSFISPTVPPAISQAENKVYRIACSSDGSKVVCIFSDRAFISNDTGDTWIEYAKMTTKSSFRGLTMSDDGSVILLSNGDGMVVRSTDGGTSHYKTKTPWATTRRAAKGIEVSPDGTTAYCLTDEGLIYKEGL